MNDTAEHWMKDKETVTVTIVMSDKTGINQLQQSQWADAGRRLDYIIDKYTFLGHYGRMFNGHSLPTSYLRHHCIVFCPLSESIPDLKRELQNLQEVFYVEIFVFISVDEVAMGLIHFIDNGGIV